MKKRTRTFIGVLLVAVLLTVNMYVRTEANEPTEVDYIDANGKDVSIYLNGSDAFFRLDKVLTSNTDNYQNFRNGYGGSYIAETGTLVVGYKNVSRDEIEQLKEEADLETAVFVEVPYTYRELEQYQGSICSYLQKYYELDEFTQEIYFTTGIDQETNCIDITLTGVDEAALDNIKSKFDGIPCTISCNGKIWKNEQTTMNPGDPIGTGGSIGFRCKRSGNKGFLTTRHSSVIGSSVTYGGTTVGTITDAKYDSFADFCFVKVTNASYITGLNPRGHSSYQLSSSDYISSTLAQNTVVYLAGRNSSNIRAGVVVTFSQTINGYGSWLISSYSSQSGDSGGCVFAKKSGNYVVLAIHNGRYGTDTDNDAYATKYTTIKTYCSPLALY